MVKKDYCIPDQTGRSDICYCGATNCITLCRRNRNMEFYKEAIERFPHHTVVSIQDKCTSYKSI